MGVGAGVGLSLIGSWLVDRARFRLQDAGRALGRRDHSGVVEVPAGTASNQPVRRTQETTSNVTRQPDPKPDPEVARAPSLPRGYP